MENGLTNLSEREERFGEIVFAYLQAREEGQRPDRREWLERYPAFGSELADFFDDQEEVDRLGAPLREIVRAGGHPSTEGPGATATANKAARHSAAPRSFGDYEIQTEMARGGMGVLYRARQRSLNRLVALKVIRAGEWASAEEVRRFRNEAETVALLDHPHVVPVYEVAEQAGQLYFSMKLVEGGSLAEHLDRYREDPKAAAGLLARVARAVHHAHQRGILHRDLKPSNILLDREGQPHISDFGLAKRVEADGSLTQTGAIVGTPQYMAPEQTSGRKEAVTTATDVYGLGAVLYALLTGRPPFRGETVLETLEQVREREPEPPHRINPKVDRDLETICLKCLQKEPQRRYESALALAEDLDRWAAGEPIRARRAKTRERIRRWLRRRPALAALLFVMGLALVGFAAGLLWHMLEIEAALAEVRQRDLEIEATVAEVRQRDLEIEATLAEVRQREREVRQQLYIQDILVASQALREEERERMRGLLDRHIPEAGQEDMRGFEWWYLQRRSRRVLHEAARVAAHEGDAYCVRYSPDGRMLASAGKDAVIRFWDSRTLRPRGELRSGQGEVNEIAFAPDGKSLASAGDDGTVCVWDLASARLRAILRPEGCRDELSTLAISSDGKILAAGGKDGQVWSWDLASGRLNAKLNPGAGWIQYVTFAPDGRFLATAHGDGQGGRILLLDPATLQERWQLKNPNGTRNCVSISHDGKTLAAGSNWEDRMLVWNLTTQTQPFEMPGYRCSTVRSLSFSPDDTLLVSGGDDSRVRLWDLRSRYSWDLWDSVQGHAGRVWSTAFAPDGEWLATAGQDGAVKLWHIRGDRYRRTIRVASEVKTAGEVVWIAFSANGQTLFTRTVNGELGRWNTLSGQREEPAGWPATAITRAALAPASRLVTMAGDQRELRVLDLSGAAVQVYRHARPILAIAISPDGERVAFADDSPAVWLWEVDSRQPRELPRLPGMCGLLAFAPDGRTIAVASDAYILLFDTARGQSLAVMRVFEEAILTIAFSPDGRLLGAASPWTGNKVRIWELPSGRERYCLWKPRTSVGATIASSPDGKTLASGNTIGEVILWDVTEGKELMRLNDQLRRCNSLAWSPDGKILAAGGLGPDAKSAVAFWYADGARPSLDP